MRIWSSASRSIAIVCLVILVSGGPSGCSPEAGLPPDGTPVVKPDSEEAKKAIAEREKMIQERQQQEAKARKKAPSLPTEG